MTLKKENVALIDKVCIYNFVVIDIDDILGLVTTDIVTITACQKFYLTNKAGDQYSYVNIKQTPLFNNFSYGISQSGYPWGRLEISIDDPEEANFNCYTAEEYRNRINEIEEYLLKNYGIYVDFTNAKYEYMEINKTVALLESFNNYARVLDLVYSNIPSQLRLNKAVYNSTKKENKVKKKKHLETWFGSSGKRGLEVCIYNKTKEMKQKHKKDVDGEYLRYEIRIKSSAKIKDAFGSNGVWDINDSSINKYWETFNEKNIISPYYDYCARRDKSVKKILKKFYIAGSHTWIMDVLSTLKDLEIDARLPTVLDIEELLPLLDCIDFGSRQVKCNAKKRFKELSKTKPAIFEGNQKRILEIINKLI